MPDMPFETQTIGPVLLHLSADTDEAVAADFERWCERRALADLASTGFLSVRRLRKSSAHSGAGPAPRFLTLYQLESPAALLGGDFSLREALPAGLAGRVRSERALYRELDAPTAPRVQAIGGAILHVTVDVEPDWTEPFLEWYVRVHVPAILEAPGMLGARRFENLELAAGRDPGPGQHSFCTLYEMESAEVVTRPETLEAAARGACPAELAPHRVAFNQAYEEVFRAPRVG